MAYLCPVCDAETQPVEEESQDGMCIHEQIAIFGILGIAGVGMVFALGIL